MTSSEQLKAAMKESSKESQLAWKLAQVASECSYIQKDGKNDFHKYRYVSAANILYEVNAALSRIGIAVYPHPELVELRWLDKGGSFALVKISLTLVDTDSGASTVIVGLGSGQDNGDKAVMKAQTAALKYAWMLALSISTGDDPEADASTDRSSEKQKPASKPLSALESASVSEEAMVLIAAIKKLPSKTELKAWTTRNKEKLQSLSETDAPAVRSAFEKRLTEVSE